MTLKSLSQYGPHFQVKVLNSLLKNKKFTLNIRDVILPSFFENQAHQWIVKETLQYFDEYNSTPTIDFLKIAVKKLENDVLRTAIIDQLKEIYKLINEDQEYVESEFSNFCKNQSLKSALLKSVDLLQDGMFDDIRFTIDSALKAGQDKNIGHEYNKDIEARFREDARTVIATPWDRINDLLQGGLGNGDFGLIFGNPGGGKSWSLVALGGFAVRMGCNVLHYTLELGEDYVGRRYDAFFTKTPVDKILKNRKKVEDVIPQLPGELIIKEFPTGRATISTVEAHIRKVKDLGVEPDLIIIDYVDLLSTNKRTSDRKGEIDDIYTSTKGLARELNIPIWSVSQVNRAGAKDDVIEGDKAAGSYDKIMITDFCLSLSRKAKDKVNGTGRFHIMKNRYGMDGLTFGVKADTSTGHFEVHDYGPDADFESETNNQQTNSYDNFGTFDKQALKNKFFELNS